MTDNQPLSSNSTQVQKAHQRREKFAELLREMFQLNQPELDFGLYRIMHARKDDINRFIDQDLPRITREAFANFASSDKAELQKELDKAIQGAQALEVDPDSLPKVQQLKAQLKDGFDLAREEGEVYDALVTFFNRYYDEGDFLSRRVYKDGTYAIPYQGEEVVLHWANKDQYYIKSSETLRDYSFRLNPQANESDPSPMRVHFKLVDAEAGAQNNNKEIDSSKRVFILDAEQPFELIQGEPNEDGNCFEELQLRFVFRAATQDDWNANNATLAELSKATAAAKKKPPVQGVLVTSAVNWLLSDASELPSSWRQLLAQPYMKANGEQADYSLLQGQLNNYTKKNSFDYFIHKDLGGFLNRELDFYIKNELLDWDDLASLKHNPARLAPLLSKVEVIRRLGESIIAFLAQLENFQKKLWLKKKFVTETQYCITLDRLSDHPALLEQVLDNKAQCEDWASLYALDLGQLAADRQRLSLAELLEQPKYRFLMLDTRHVSEDFKAELLATIDDLDEQCGGLLVHSENFQALNLLQERYREQVKCIYIDPPYNTDASPIIYKNGFRSSSWSSMLNDRIYLSKNILCPDGIQCSTIDDFQYRELNFILGNIFGDDNIIGTVVIRNNPAGRSTKLGFAISHEYAIFSSKNTEVKIGRLEHTQKQKERYKEADEIGAYEWVNFRKHGGANANRSARPKLYYPIVISENGVRIPKILWNEDQKIWELCEQIFENEKIVYPIAEDGLDKTWKWESSAVKKNISEFSVKPDRTGALGVYLKARINEDGTLPTTVWTDSKYSASEHGTNVLKNMFPGEQAFSFPKSVHAVKDCITVASNGDVKAVFLDYFAGSGTTAHAVIDLNRKDSGERKYILAEMGGYFDTVTVNRIKKVVYAAKWSRNCPQLMNGTQSGVSHCFKYIRLESYEDALGNLALHRSKGQQTLLEAHENSELDAARQSYVMNYMLEVETRGSASLLNTKLFTDPTAYQLNVRSASGDETKAVNVDLLETFNYLLGLEVEHIAAPIWFDAEITQGEFGRWQAQVKRVNVEDLKGMDDAQRARLWWFRTVYGVNRAGQKVLVVWRNLPSVIAKDEKGLLKDNAVLDAVLIERLHIRLTSSQDDEVDILYVNGDHNIAIPKNRRGELMEEARVQLIEEAFHRLMFANTESGEL
jgi:adenine-specific DNA-methyltransferase